MTNKKTSRLKIALAVITGLASGTARALATWALAHLP
jgi:hypothetical protein